MRSGAKYRIRAFRDRSLFSKEKLRSVRWLFAFAPFQTDWRQYKISDLFRVMPPLKGVRYNDKLSGFALPGIFRSFIGYPDAIAAKPSFSLYFRAFLDGSTTTRNLSSTHR